MKLQAYRSHALRGSAENAPASRFLVPMLRMGIHTAVERQDGLFVKPGLHSHAERGNENLLKIQSKTNSARRYAKERELTMQRDIAFYNQAVGMLP